MFLSAETFVKKLRKSGYFVIFRYNVMWLFSLKDWK